MKKIDLIIFDLDGTLIDSLDDLTSATNHMLQSLGRIAATREQVRGYVGQGARRLVEQAMPDASPTEIEKGLSLVISYNEEHIAEKTRFYSGVPETLAALREAEVILAVVSNKNVDLCSRVLTALGADGFFSSIMGADSLAQRKPSPEPLLKVLRDFGVATERAVMVGDSINDVAAGKAAGVLTVGCTYGYGDREEIVGADFLIDSVPDLLILPPLRGE